MPATADYLRPLGGQPALVPAWRLGPEVPGGRFASRPTREQLDQRSLVPAYEIAVARLDPVLRAQQHFPTYRPGCDEVVSQQVEELNAGHSITSTSSSTA